MSGEFWIYVSFIRDQRRIALLFEGMSLFNQLLERGILAPELFLFGDSAYLNTCHIWLHHSLRFQEDQNIHTLSIICSCGFASNVPSES